MTSKSIIIVFNFIVTHNFSSHCMYFIFYPSALSVNIFLKLCFLFGTSNSKSLQWRHNGRDDVSNHQPHDCLLNRLFRRRSKKTSKLRVTGLCAGNSPVTGEFPAQMASSAENVSIWWRHHVNVILFYINCSSNCVSLNKRETITWTNNDPIHRRRYASSCVI